MFAAWHDDERYSVIVAESAEAVHKLAARRGITLHRVDELPRKDVKRGKVRKVTIAE